MKKKLFIFVIFLLVSVGAYIYHTKYIKHSFRAKPPTENVRIAYGAGSFLTFDPHLHDEQVTLSVLSNIYEPLVVFGKDFQICPKLALSWSNPNKYCWIFVIRTGIKFHNGQTLKVGDIVYSIRRAAFYRKSALRNYFSTIKEIKVTGPRTISIITKKPDPLLLNKLTLCMIVPEYKNYEYRVLSNQPVGTGPYKFDKWLNENTFVLRKFDSYWSNKGNVENISIINVPDKIQRLSLFLNGLADIATDMDCAIIRKLKRYSTISTFVSHTNATTMIALNTQKYINGKFNPLSILKVRQAINIALNRKKFLVEVSCGLGKIAYQYVPPTVFGYFDSYIPPVKSIKKARKLFSEAGYKNGFSMSITTSKSNKSKVIIVARQLKKLNIKTNINLIKPGNLIKALEENRKMQSFIFGWDCASGDESDFFESFVHSRIKSNGLGLLNNVGYKNEQVDRWIEKSRHEMDVDSRKALMIKINRKLLEELPYIPLMYDIDVFCYKTGLQFQPDLAGKINFNKIKWSHITDNKK